MTSILKTSRANVAIVLAVFLLLAGSGAIWLQSNLSAPGPETSRSDSSGSSGNQASVAKEFSPLLKGEPRAHAMAVYGDWIREGSFVDIADPGGVREAFVSAITDPDQILSADQRAALVERLFRQAQIRSSASPASYIKFVDNDPGHRWVQGSQESRSAVRFYEWHFNDNKESGETEARALIEEVWAEFMAKNGARIAPVGSGRFGSRIAIGRNYSGELSEDLGLRTEEFMRHFAVGMILTTPPRFMRPEMTIGEAVGAYGSVVAAECHVLARLANGEVIRWFSWWWLKPGTDDWICTKMEFSWATTNAQFLY